MKLTIGATVPDFQLPNCDNALVHLQELVKTQRVVLVFYRGAW